MRQVLGPGALGRPGGSGWRGRWEGGSGWGRHVYGLLYLASFHFTKCWRLTHDITWMQSTCNCWIVIPMFTLQIFKWYWLKSARHYADTSQILLATGPQYISWDSYYFLPIVTIHGSQKFVYFQHPLSWFENLSNKNAFTGISNVSGFNGDGTTEALIVAVPGNVHHPRQNLLH